MEGSFYRFYMKFHLDYVPCLLRQALQASQFASNNEKVQRYIMKESIILINSSLDNEQLTTSQISQHLQKIIRDRTKSVDPYKVVKKKYNKLALSLEHKLQEIIDSASDSLYMALKLSIAANIIDFGAKERFDVQRTIQDVIDSPLAIDAYYSFKKRIESIKQIAYLTDNTGEIVFDKLLIRQLLNYPNIENITLFAKSAPTLNDAMIEDYVEIGLDKLSKTSFDILNIELSTDSSIKKGFLESLDKFDLVISKGQGNFEEFMDQPFFFLLMVKCNLVAKQLQVLIDQPVFLDNTIN